jgi:DNA polymerase III alpha subunit
MRVDKYGQMIFTEDDLCSYYLSNNEKPIKSALVETDIRFDQNLLLENIPILKKYQELNLSIEEYDTNLQNNWFMPSEYYSMDIAQWILDQCKTDAELQRAGEELIMFQERNMFNLLKYLKYLVDTLRKNNIVWGVGRGSSVASFVLFLIGIHKINSLYYDLSIDEFLK